MGWHDATVHALHIQQTDELLPRMLLDIDYIVRWIHPDGTDQYFSFWVSPATLVFEDVWDLQGDLDFTGFHPRLEIDAIHRLAPDNGPQGTQRWHIEGHSFDLRFGASRYRQYFRRAPQLTTRPVLTQAERGDCTFTETGFGPT
jgi:hypothetical protein